MRTHFFTQQTTNKNRAESESWRHKTGCPQPTRAEATNNAPHAVDSISNVFLKRDMTRERQAAAATIAVNKTRRRRRLWHRQSIRPDRVCHRFGKFRRINRDSLACDICEPNSEFKFAKNSTHLFPKFQQDVLRPDAP
jgi:hypothetical protein